MVGSKLLKAGLVAGCVSLAFVSFSLADEMDDDIDVKIDTMEGMDSMGTMGTKSAGRFTGARDADMDSNMEGMDSRPKAPPMTGDFVGVRETNIDAARELSIVKFAPYKIPQLPQYMVEPLLEEAKGIAVVNGVPLNCKLLGESEGLASSDGKSAPSFEMIREGALNALRNNVIDLGDPRDRIILTPIKEAMTCEFRLENSQFEEKDCTQWTQIPNNGKILYYRIHANVYDCGVK